MDNSKIEWTDSTWNPVRGCARVSEGCVNCYAERIAGRFSGEGQPYEGLINHTEAGPVWNNEIMLVPHVLEQPLQWKKPRRIFVNSMSDLFHPKVPDDYIKKVFDVMHNAYWHTFQILTKRPEAMRLFAWGTRWEPNIWAGVSVENEAVIDRIRILRSFNTLAGITKFLSLEPLIGPLMNLNLKGISWVIVGGESGPNCRPMREEWVMDIKAQCEEADVPFFFKQWGGTGKDKGGRLLAGKTYDAMPKESIND